MSAEKLIEDVLAAQDKFLETKKQLDQALADRDTAKQVCLAAICPFKENDKVVVDTNKVFHANHVSLLIDRKSKRASWEASGVLDVYGSQAQPKKRRHTLNTEQWDQIDQEVRNTTVEQVERAHQEKMEQKRERGMARALTLGASQKSMLKHLFSGVGEQNFASNQLPRGIVWSSHGQTQAIWQALIDKGVLDLVKTQPQQGAAVVSYYDWVVAPGPRMEQACELARIRFSQESLDKARKKHRPARKAKP